MKFKLIKDLHTNDGIETIVVYKKDSIFEPNNDGLYSFTFMDKVKTYTKEELLLKEDMFVPIKEEVSLDVSEINTSEDDVVRRYRIQLDVKTSLTNLKKIEKFIKENIPDYL